VEAQCRFMEIPGVVNELKSLLSSIGRFRLAIRWAVNLEYGGKNKRGPSVHERHKGDRLRFRRLSEYLN